MMRWLYLMLLLSCGVAAPAAAKPAEPISAPASLQRQVETILATAPAGTRWGMLVTDQSGREVVAINPDQRFIPASNTKLFTTAAALAIYPGLDRPDSAGGTEVALVPVVQKSRSMLESVSATGPLPRGAIDVWLSGRGDARMSSAADCQVDCLATLADSIAAKTSNVRDVVGDDSLWPDQRWSPGMSWNNIGTDSGTAVSALSLDDNELQVSVKPAALGQAPGVQTSTYFTLRNEAVTVAAGRPLKLWLERPVNGTVLRVYGEIPADSAGWFERIGIDDPAHYAAWMLSQMLAARGVRVTGKVRVSHRAAAPFDALHDPGVLGTPIHVGFPALAKLTPPALAEDVATINKVSQNLHAELLLRRIGDMRGTGSQAWAVDGLNKMLEKAGIPRAGYDFSDGSGMSTYNRVSPRAGVALLRWGQAQPWGQQWRASFPIGGVDGTLRRRFAGTALQGKVFAKTGTLNATNALSGYLIAASGTELTFSFFANDVPDGGKALPAMDAALLAIAAAN